MKLFDAHSHLQEAAVYERARAAGVEHVAVCGTSPKDWRKVLQLADSVSSVYPMAGLHPWFVPAESEIAEMMYRLEQLLRDHPEAGIGETGLDFQKKFTNHREQEISFRSHLRLARALNRPVAVHCVHAWGRLVEILREQPVPRGIILHAYSGSSELVPELAELNCRFSFCGSVTNPKAKRVRATVPAVPSEKLLAETDSPDFSPFGCEAPNEPANLVHIVKEIALLRHADIDKISRITENNAKSLFI